MEKQVKKTMPPPKDSTKEETEEEKEFRLKRLFNRAILDERKARVHGKVCRIEGFDNFHLKYPDNISSLSDGEILFKAEADVDFSSKDKDGAYLSFGIINFHGIIIKDADSFSIKEAIIIDKETGLSLTSLDYLTEGNE